MPATVAPHDAAAAAGARDAADSLTSTCLRRFAVRVEERRERFLIAHVDAPEAHAACEAATAQACAMGWRAAAARDCGAERLVYVSAVLACDDAPHAQGEHARPVQVPWPFDRIARQLAAAGAPQPAALTVAERRAELAALAAAGLTLADCIAVFGDSGHDGGTKEHKAC